MMRFTAVLLAVLFCSAVTYADSVYYPKAYKRAGTWETALQVRWESSESIDAQYNTDVDIDSDWGFGFGVAYNFDQHWNLGVEFSTVNADYHATYLANVPGAKPQEFSHELDNFSFMTNLTYHFMEGDFTPYVQGSLGWSQIDSNVVSNYNYGGCWWDPWWGYVCGGTYDTYDDDGFTWGAGAGLRWDYISNAFARISVNQQWMDLGSTSDDLTFVITKLELGWKF